MRTKERLAQVLREAKLAKMAALAAQGYYDDFESPLATPIMQLVRDLEAANRPDLAWQAKNGEWDATKEEAEEWFEREGRKLLER